MKRCKLLDCLGCHTPKAAPKPSGAKTCQGAHCSAVLHDFVFSSSTILLRPSPVSLRRCVTACRSAREREHRDVGVLGMGKKLKAKASGTAKADDIPVAMAPGVAGGGVAPKFKKPQRKEVAAAAEGGAKAAQPAPLAGGAAAPPAAKASKKGAIDDIFQQLKAKPKKVGPTGLHAVSAAVSRCACRVHHAPSALGSDGEGPLSCSSFLWPQATRDLAIAFKADSYMNDNPLCPGCCRKRRQRTGRRPPSQS